MFENSEYNFLHHFYGRYSAVFHLDCVYESVKHSDIWKHFVAKFTLNALLTIIVSVGVN